MYEDNVVTPRPRARLVPYLFGGLTGVSIALVVLAGVLLSRHPRVPNDSSAIPSTGGASSYRTASTAGSTSDEISSDRRNAIVRATEQVAPAVITINAIYTRRTRPVYDWYWNRYYPGRKFETANLGSGIIIDAQGYAFTNYHVVENAERIQVTLHNGSDFTAKLVGSAPSYDLALIKLEGDEFQAAPLGDSDDLLIGEWAIAIGSPYGLYLADTQPTVTVGVISAMHRDIKQDPDSPQIFNDMIQTDAAINPGNSGGPLVNARGEVIGINTIIFTGAGSNTNIGLGFAIPINRARFVFDEIVKHGRVRNVWLGMTAATITPQLQAALDLPTANGVIVQGIEEGGPAQKGGLKPGDQIIAINGVAVESREQANRMIFGSAVGKTLEMTINRKDDLIKLKVTLEERPKDI
jgi:serine protease Do